MRSFTRVGQVWLVLLMMLFLVVGVGVLAQAKTLNVANNGVDSATCGANNSPCRSISQAISNASAGDKIIVGPGRYGDLNGNGTFGETGEETAPGSCLCMVLVNKQLTLESRDGAGATVLDAAGAANIDVVQIAVSGVVFGKKKKGFTLTHAGPAFDGLFISDGTTGVKVTGNLATANGGSGFFAEGSGHMLTSNIASANGFSGFVSFDSRHLLSGNLAIANGFSGFDFFGSGHTLTGNAAVGNKAFGILIVDSGGVDSATITKNNLFGNNGVTTAGFTNCGLLNQSGDPINAAGNFWGVATGPSSAEPADNVCDDTTNFPGSITTFAPFATKEFKVKTTAFLDEPGLVVPTDSQQSETLAPASVPTQFLKEMQTKEGLLFRATANVSALRVEVTDLSGRTVYDSGFVKGESLSWARVSTQNKPIANGVYLYRLTALDRDGNEIQSELRKLIFRR